VSSVPSTPFHESCDYGWHGSAADGPVFAPQADSRGTCQTRYLETHTARPHVPLRHRKSCPGWAIRAAAGLWRDRGSAPAGLRQCAGRSSAGWPGRTADRRRAQTPTFPPVPGSARTSSSSKVEHRKHVARASNRMLQHVKPPSALASSDMSMLRHLRPQASSRPRVRGCASAVSVTSPSQSRLAENGSPASISMILQPEKIAGSIQFGFTIRQSGPARVTALFRCRQPRGCTTRAVKPWG